MVSARHVASATASSLFSGAKCICSATSKTAKKAKLSYDISALQKAIRKRKRQFGEEVFDALNLDFTEEAKRLLAACKEDIANMHNEMTHKKMELEHAGERGEEGMVID